MKGRCQELHDYPRIVGSGEVAGLGELIAGLLFSLPSFGLLVPLIWVLYIGLSISAAPLLAVATVLLLSLLLPLFELSGRPNRWWLPALCFGLAVLFTGVGLSTAAASARRPAPSSLLYAMDRDAGRATWATTQEESDEWLARFVGADAEWRDLGSFVPGARRRYRFAGAPLLQAQPLEVRVLEDNLGAGERSLRLAVRSPAGAEMVQVQPASPGAIALRAVNGKQMPPAPAAPSGQRNGPDPTAPEWVLQHWGEPVEAITLELDSRSPGEPIELVFVEYLMHLPRLPGGPDIDRPPELAPNVRTLTDVTLIRQVMAF
ncbi:MAG: hypothetical protein ACE5HV_08160 [Acidobacteriota bacterium]